MSNLLLGWPNRIDAATLSSGSWVAGLPLTNLKNRDQWQVARSTDATITSTKFQVDLGALYPVRALALANHNLSQNSAWRIKLGTTAGASDIYDSAAQAVWHLSFDTDLLEWESSSLWEGIVGDAVTGFPYLALHTLGEGYTARYATIEIIDTANPDGYVQIGRTVICGGFEPTTNANYGLQDGWDDKSEIVDSESGHPMAVLKRRYRWVRFGLSWNSHTEAAIIHEMQRRLGVYGEVLYVPDMSDQQAAQRYGMLGRIAELSAIDYPYPNIRSVGFQIKEL